MKMISKSKHLFNVQVRVTLCFCSWSDLRAFTKSSYYRALPAGTLLSPNYLSSHTDGFPSLDNVQLILSLYHCNSIHWQFYLKNHIRLFSQRMDQENRKLARIIMLPISGVAHFNVTLPNQTEFCT
jgi:hypothetical protein